MTKAALITALMLAGAPALAQTAQPAGPPDTAAPTTPPASEQAPGPGTTTTAPSTTTTAPSTTTPSTTTTQPADQSAPTTTTGPTDQSTSGAAAPTTGETNSTAEGQASTAASSDPIAATVSADWAKYDANSNKNLNRAEFNKWIGDLQKAAEKKAPTRAYLSNAFRKADGDKSGTVSQDELTAFLKG